MADAEHAPAMAPPVRTDEQIMPRIRWVPIGKSNCYLNEEKSQPSPIYKIAVDILKQTNFFRAFTASSTIPAKPYIQSIAGSRLSTTTRPSLLPPTPNTLLNLSRCGKNLLNPSIPSQKTKGIWHNILWEEEKQPLIPYPEYQVHKVDHISPAKRLHNFHQNPRFSLHLPTEETCTRHLVVNRSSNPESPATKATKPTKQARTQRSTRNQPFLKLQPRSLTCTGQTSGEEAQAGVRVVEAPPLAKRAKAGKVVKKRTVKSSKQLVDSSLMKRFLLLKPRHEDTNGGDTKQKVPRREPTDVLPNSKGSSSPVVFRETDTGETQTTAKCRKWKEKVGEEQAAQVLLHLQTPKKKCPAEQYIFQRHTPVPSEPAVVRSGAQDEGQAGPDPGKLDEGQAGPNPDDVAKSQPLPTPSVLAGPNLEHSDVEITDASIDNRCSRKPVISTGCFVLLVLQHLTKDFSYDDQFINDKPSEANNEKTTADTEAESMVSITIQ
ncbi:hypothetical protein Tco_1201357 [Tanacetum coccineum]